MNPKRLESKKNLICFRAEKKKEESIFIERETVAKILIVGRRR